MQIKREVRTHDISRCTGLRTGINYHFFNDPTGKSNKIPMGEPSHPSNSFEGCRCSKCKGESSA